MVARDYSNGVSLADRWFARDYSNGVSLVFRDCTYMLTVLSQGTLLFFRAVFQLILYPNKQRQQCKLT